MPRILLRRGIPRRFGSQGALGVLGVVRCFAAICGRLLLFCRRFAAICGRFLFLGVCGSLRAFASKTGSMPRMTRNSLTCPPGSICKQYRSDCNTCHVALCNAPSWRVVLQNHMRRFQNVTIPLVKKRSWVHRSSPCICLPSCDRDAKRFGFTRLLPYGWVRPRHGQKARNDPASDDWMATKKSPHRRSHATAAIHRKKVARAAREPRREPRNAIGGGWTTSSTGARVRALALCRDATRVFP